LIVVIVCFVDIGGIVYHHCLKKSLPKGKSKFINRKRTDNTMAKRRRTDNTMAKRKRTDNTCY
jgi:hypothetical protein